MIGTSFGSPQQFLSAALLSVAFGACGGGGGGGGGAANAAPQLVAAAIEGSNGPPTAGDFLVLTFSEDVQLVANTLLTDADFVLSANATLGTVTANPTLVAANRVSVRLGAGAALTPDVTTITLRTRTGNAGNDAVRDALGAFGINGAAVTIKTSDDQAPQLTNLTIAGVDDELNGTGPARGRLQVPRSGWTIDADFTDNGTLAANQTLLTASVTVSTLNGAAPAGTNLTPFLAPQTPVGNRVSFLVPATVGFPDGPVTLTCIVVDASGLGSTPLTFAATVRAFSPERQPFETTANPSQVWVLDFSRDIESFSAPAQNGGVTVISGANGRSDFEDILRILGLNSSTPIGNVRNGQDSNQVVNDLLQTALLSELANLYSGVNIVFTRTQPSGSFGNASFVPYASLGFSRISIAGSSDLTGVLGVAIFDSNNVEQNDNTVLDFGGTRLGVFLHTIVDSGFKSSPSTLFQQTYTTFAPALGGTPIGNVAGDDGRILSVGTGNPPDGRADAIATAIADLARFISVVAGHECGHSMGLVQNGAMPVGLYGNDQTNFPGSTDGHIRTPTLFPPPTTNVMSPALSYESAVHPASAFNSLNLAYLREQVTYGN